MASAQQRYEAELAYASRVPMEHSPTTYEKVIRTTKNEVGLPFQGHAADNYYPLSINHVIDDPFHKMSTSVQLKITSAARAAPPDSVKSSMKAPTIPTYVVRLLICLRAWQLLSPVFP